MMSKLAIIFVAVLVAVVAATPNNLQTSLKTLGHLKKAATLLNPLQPVQKQEKRMTKDEYDTILMILDKDHDGMLNVQELKVLLTIGGASPSKLDTYVMTLMMFDKDKNQKLDFTEIGEIFRLAGF